MIKNTKKKPRKPKVVKAPVEKKERRSVAQQMVDALRKEMRNEGAARTLGGNGYSAVREVLPTKIDALDRHVIGVGGLPYGRIVEISGPEDTGKSSLVNHLMWAAQQDGAVASLGDAERKVQPNWVDVFQVKRDDILLLPANTVEEWLREVTITIRKFGKRHKLAFFLDSVATTLPQKALDENLTENEIPGAMAAAWSRGLRQLNGPLSESLAVVVLVNQIRQKIGNLYGPTETTAGGWAMKYYPTLKLSVGHGPAYKLGAAHMGKWANVRATKNHLAPNHRSAKVLLNFDRGWDDARSTLLFAKETGVVDSKCASVREARAALGWEAPAVEGAPAVPEVAEEKLDDVNLKEKK